MAWLIIVIGRPAAGKTTLATWLGKQLALPVVSKDAIKDILFNELGWHDCEWSKMLGRASIELMYYVAQTLLGAGGSITLDNTFHPDLASPRILALVRQTNAETLQIICNANNEVLFQRFKQRTESGLRHEGHVDMHSLEELKASLEQNRPLRLDIGGEVIEVDTTDFTALRYESILAQVEAIIGDTQLGHLRRTREGSGNELDELLPT